MPTVEVPGHGDVEFPDSMKDEEIASAIRGMSGQQHGTAAKIAHYAAKALPLVGGIAGGVLGAPAGAGLGSVATGAVGAGLLSAAGRAGQHAVDQWLGYEKPMSNTDAVKDTVATGVKDAALTGVAGMGMQVASRALPMASELAKGGARAIEQRILTNKTNPFSKQKAISPEALDEAADRGAFKFFGTSAGAAKRLQAMRETQGAEYGQIIKQLEAHGITGPDASSMAQKMLSQRASVSATTMNPAVPNIYDSAAERLGTMVKPPVSVRTPATYQPSQGAVQLPGGGGSPSAPNFAPSEAERLAEMHGMPMLPQARAAEENARAVGGSVDAEKMRRILAGREAGSTGSMNAVEARNAADALYTAERMGAAEGMPAPSVPGEAERIAQATGMKEAPGTRPLFALPGAPQASTPGSVSFVPQDSRLPLSRIEDLKRSAQGMARSAYKQMQPNEIGQAHKQVASILRQGAEDAIAAQAPNASPVVQDLAARFVPVKKSLGNIIEASDLADEGMRAAGRRHFFSLPDKAAMIAEFTRSHSPARAALTGAVTHLLQTRGPSSAATILRGSSRLADALARSPQAVPVGAAVTGPVAAESLPLSLEAALAAIRRKQSPMPQLAQNQ